MPSAEIHPTAIVDPKAALGEGVQIGPLAIIEADTEIGDGTIVEAQAQVLRWTRIGRDSKIGRSAIIGGDPQSLSFDTRTPTGVEIGEKNNLRELVTVHRSTQEGKATRLGDRNFFMASSHVGHDCIVGNDNVVANSLLFGGHMTVGNFNYLGGASAYHQFIVIGDYCMVQGLSGFSTDIPHFTMVCNINEMSGLNIVGLRRAGFTPAERSELKEVFRIVFSDKKTISEGVAAARERSWSAPAEKFLKFVENPSKRGFPKRR